jgi:hypothetical protein
MVSARIEDVLQHTRRLVGGKPDSVSDGELLQRFVATGEAAAFEELLSRHGAMVLRVCRRLLPGPEDAEDVFQATFLLLARKANSIQRLASVGPWLHGVAFRLAQQDRAAVARRRRHEGRAALRTSDDLLDELSVREARAVLHEELARLPQGHRVVAVSPDGKVVAAGGGDRSIHLWESATGKRLHRLLPPADQDSGGGVLCLAFSPDGRRLASGGACRGRSLRRSSCASSGRLRFWKASALRGCNPCGGWPPARREHG